MKDLLISISEFTARYLFAIVGAIFAFLQPTIPFILVCTLAIFMDCYTAWSLSRRVKKKYPNSNDGKFKSYYMGRVFMTLLKVYFLIVLAYCIEKYIFSFSIALPNIVAGAVCFWQVWSMLENEASCSDRKWARMAQRFLIDKTERHFDVDLSELKPKQRKASPAK